MRVFALAEDSSDSPDRVTSWMVRDGDGEFEPDDSFAVKLADGLSGGMGSETAGSSTTDHQLLMSVKDPLLERERGYRDVSRILITADAASGKVRVTFVSCPQDVKFGRDLTSSTCTDCDDAPGDSRVF